MFDPVQEVIDTTEDNVFKNSEVDFDTEYDKAVERLDIEDAYNEDLNNAIPATE